MWHDLSITFKEIVLSNKFSFETQRYLEDSYIPVFDLIYTVGVAAIEMQLSQHFLLMTFFITEIIEGIVSAILMT